MRSSRTQPSRDRSRGYTLVELMMALALFAVAVLGIISMQKVTVTANAHAKNVALAQRIAQAWAAQLEMDGTAWQVGTTFGDGWLNRDNTWQHPRHIDARRFSGAFDALGNALPEAKAGQAQFCTHVRMTWLYPDTMGVGGNGTLRAEIRVFWLRDSESPVGVPEFCAPTQDATVISAIGLATDRYHFVYQTVGIRQHSQI